MKTTLLKIAAALALAASSAFAHQDIELGPNGGRILEFSKDETMHGEVTVLDGSIHIALLDKAMKPVAIDRQTLTATTGDRTKPEKLKVEAKDGKFVVPLQKGGDHWTILQFRPSADAKPITARFHYETAICPTCKKQEWLCACAAEKGAKKEK